MGFMKPQIVYGAFWRVETTAGTEFIDADLIGRSELDDCCEGTIEEDEDPEMIHGWGARLSAPGYLDCTDWSVFNTQEKAESELREMYPEAFEED